MNKKEKLWVYQFIRQSFPDHSAPWETVPSPAALHSAAGARPSSCCDIPVGLGLKLIPWASKTVRNRQSEQPGQAIQFKSLEYVHTDVIVEHLQRRADKKIQGGNATCPPMRCFGSPIFNSFDAPINCLSASSFAFQSSKNNSREYGILSYWIAANSISSIELPGPCFVKAQASGFGSDSHVPFCFHFSRLGSASFSYSSFVLFAARCRLSPLPISLPCFRNKLSPRLVFLFL